MRPVPLFGVVASITFLLTCAYFLWKPINDEIPVQSVDQEAVIMGYMGNKTQKAELGTATWKFLHTMMARYPEKPTKQESKAMYDFMMLFSRLYPCGECAIHFNKLLQQYPPQTSSRVTASQWLCAMHNKVNERVHKPIFDCNDIESKYPCGCDDAKV